MPEPVSSTARLRIGDRRVRLPPPNLLRAGSWTKPGALGSALMLIVSLQSARARFSRLIDAAAGGVESIIAKAVKPVGGAHAVG